MKKTIVYIVLAALCPFFKVAAQNKANISAIKIHDRVPDVAINNIVNYSTKTAKISDFKGKLLILDFWATWCSSCLGHFPLADSLQHEFKNEIQILLVNGFDTKDNKDRILKTLLAFNKPGLVKFGLPSVIQDTVLTQMFPHFYIPHYVWIDKDGFVMAITSGDELTKANIANLLKDRQVPKFNKVDFDPQKPLYTSEDLPKDNLRQFSILLKGRIDGMGSGTREHSINDTRGIVFNNRGLLDLFTRICEEKIPGLSENRLLLEVKDLSKLSFSASKQKRQDWERENYYNYELIVPQIQFNLFFDFMLDDLNRYSPYKAAIEKRKMFCWILEKVNKKDVIHTHGGENVNALNDTSNSRLINSSMFNLCIYLNEISGNAIILDKTGYTQNIDLEFKSPVKDMNTMKRKLRAYGLKLYSAHRMVDMLIIKDK